jgi:uncharacterized protein (TIGR02271 family)
MGPRTSWQRWDELILLLAVVAALVIAAAVSGAFDSPQAWTLLAVLAGAYALSRGAARNRWRAAPRPVRIQATVPEHGARPRTAEPLSGDAGAEVVVSEERLDVDKVRRPHERVRLYKEVVTEQVTITVPVRREVVRLERVPIEPGDELAASALTELSSGQSDELILMEEQAVVDKRVVPRERVWLEKDVVTEEQQITETLRREEVDVDVDRAPQPDATRQEQTDS